MVARLFSGSCVIRVLSLESLSVALSVLIWSAAALTFDCDRLGGDCERGVDAEILPRVERDPVNVGGREAGACDRDHVLAGFDVVEQIRAISVGCGGAVGVLFYAVQGDGCSRNRGAR